MKTYVKPRIVDFGKSQNVIKGECGWGTENAWLDKTGAYHTSGKDYVLCGGGIPAGQFIYCCTTVTKCSTESNGC
ncbi:hypothetical protein D3C87_902550 [compost metagenome]